MCRFFCCCCCCALGLLFLGFIVFEFCIAFGLSALDTFVLCHMRLKASLTTHTHLKYVHVRVDPRIYALPTSVCVRALAWGWMIKGERKGCQINAWVKLRERNKRKTQSPTSNRMFDLWNETLSHTKHYKRERTFPIHWDWCQFVVKLTKVININENT